MARVKTNLRNSFNLRTDSDTLTPQYQVNDVPIGGNTSDAGGDTTLTGEEDVVYVTVSSTITFPSASSDEAYKAITIRALTGITATLAATTGTMEFTSVTSDTARTMHPRSADNTWRQI